MRSPLKLAAACAVALIAAGAVGIAVIPSERERLERELRDIEVSRVAGQALITSAMGDCATLAVIGGASAAARCRDEAGEITQAVRRNDANSAQRRTEVLRRLAQLP